MIFAIKLTSDASCTFLCFVPFCKNMFSSWINCIVPDGPCLLHATCGQSYLVRLTLIYILLHWNLPHSRFVGHCVIFQTEDERIDNSCRFVGEDRTKWDICAFLVCLPNIRHLKKISTKWHLPRNKSKYISRWTMERNVSIYQFLNGAGDQSWRARISCNTSETSLHFWDSLTWRSDTA